MQYYEINENAARRAKEANSWSDYVQGSATAEYRQMVDAAAEIAELQKRRVGTEYHGKIDELLDAYARKLAANMNKRNEIDARVPSVMIAGGSNFPVRKKEKQNAARDANWKEYEYIQGILDRIRSTGMGGIMSDDQNAIQKLTAKLEAREAAQEHMKAVNAYFRKHKTLNGCPELTDEQRRHLEADMARGWRANPVPFESWALSNNNAEIRRIRDRIAALQKEAERAEANRDAEPVTGDGYKLIENADAGRIQFVFDGKPDEETRQLLKSWGFKWAPSQGAWQRMLNDHGRYAAKQVRAKLDAKEAIA